MGHAWFTKTICCRSGSSRHFQLSVTRQSDPLSLSLSLHSLCLSFFSSLAWMPNMSSSWLQQGDVAGFQAPWYRLPVWASWASCVSAKEVPTQQTQRVWWGLLYSRSQLDRLSPGLTLSQPGNPTRAPKTSLRFSPAVGGIELDVLSFSRSVFRGSPWTVKQMAP